jgi:hypothetical protein
MYYTNEETDAKHYNKENKTFGSPLTLYACMAVCTLWFAFCSKKDIIVFGSCVCLSNSQGINHIGQQGNRTWINQKTKPWHPSDENEPKQTSLYLLIQLDHVPELEPPSMGANQQQQQTREMLYHRQFHCLAATERLERTSFSTEVTKST